MKERIKHNILRFGFFILKPFKVFNFFEYKKRKQQIFLSFFYHFCQFIENKTLSFKEFKNNKSKIFNISFSSNLKNKYRFQINLDKFFEGKFDSVFNEHKFYVAVHEKNIIKTSNPKILDDELYRFVNNPLIQIKELDNLIEELTGVVTNKLSNHFLAGVHLRRSNPSYYESHTNGFHRDTNSFKTFKLFVPLNEFRKPFLEYLPKTELNDLFFPAFYPSHISKADLFYDFPQLKNEKSYFTNVGYLKPTLVNTTAIHRENPSLEIRYNLILTYLKHRDFGFGNFLINNGTASKWRNSPYKYNLLKFAKVI